MFHIYIKTPLHNNSNYIPHIIEHCVFGKVTENTFFKFELIDAGCYIYHSYFILDTNSQKELNDFIDKIQKPISKEVINFEYEVIKEEVNDNNYSQNLTGNIGKIFYGKTFKYSKIEKKIYSTIQLYHKKYYTKSNIIILENNIKYYKGNLKSKSKSELYKKIDLKIGLDKDTVYVFEHGIIELFIISLLSDLMDYYIKYSNSKKIYLQDKDFDGSCMVKYGYTLSDKDKKELLDNLGVYYTNLVSQL